MKDLFNKSDVTVPVKTGGTTVYLPPRGHMQCESVENELDVREHCTVTENLTEVGDRSLKKGKRLNG